MTITFPVVVCLIGGISSLSLGWRMRSFSVPDTPPKSRAHLSREQRQRKIKIAERILYAMGVFFLAGAVVLAWLAM